MSASFSTRTHAPRDPAISVFEITPSDSTDLPRETTALNVATPGTVRVTMVDGTTADLTIHPGHSFPAQARRVWATGTSATGIRGLI